MNLDTALCISNGNEQAALFLVDYVEYCHMLDDIVDKDKPATDERLVRSSLNFITHFVSNPFVQANAERLLPLIISGFNAWVDSNRMAGSADTRERLSSDVVKGIYHEVGYFVAYLCGGHEHMRKVSQGRKYNYDQKG